MKTYNKYFIALALIILILIPIPLYALTLYSPTPDQIVRENVRFTISESALPAGGYVGLFIGPDKEFVAGINPNAGRRKDGKIHFFWNSKAPFRDPANPTEERRYPDGRHLMEFRVFDSSGKMVDSAEVYITLQNRVPRTTPAPPVRLVNSLPFGKLLRYDARAQVSLFDNLGAPISGGLGMTSEFTIIQTIEDVRPNGDIMVRLRLDDNAAISIQGNRTFLYRNTPVRPQLYRMLNRYGVVSNRNIFGKQAHYSIMDVIPVLPSRPAKEGDSWQSELEVNIEGLARPMLLKGNSMLDSFEWQDGRRCAKIISRLSSDTRINMLDGKIKTAAGGKVNAIVTTFFAYESGRMIKRNIKLEFNADLDQSLIGGRLQSGTSTAPGSMTPSMMLPRAGRPAFDEEDDEKYGTPETQSSHGITELSGTRPGIVQIDVDVRVRF
ncbi:MAG: hypothetical protein SNJ70_08645 [Armatimonadota bacterium]